MVDQPDHVKPVSDDAGIGKVLAHDCPVHAGQIHADNSYPVLAFEPMEIAFERSFAAAEDHVMNTVRSEVAEGGSVAVPAGEEMLIDAEHGRTNGIAPLIEGQLEKAQKPALHGRAGDAFALGQTAAADAVKVPAVDAFAIGLCSAMAGLDTRKALPEPAATAETLELPGNQFKHGGTFTPVLVAERSQPFVARTKRSSFTVGAANLTCEYSANPIDSRDFSDFCNLVAGQAQQRF